MSEQRLTGNVAVVTGAGKGIGEAIAKALAREGAAVFLGARTEADIERVAAEISAEGGVAYTQRLDVTRMSDVRRLIERAHVQFGKLDILVNNAGSAVFESVADSDADDWWRTVEVNLKGTYLCSRAAVPKMIERGQGHIVNILSIAANTAFPMSSAYCASKAGGLMFTRVLSAEVREEGVRVSAVLPGSTRTPFWENQDSPLDLTKMMPPERVAEAVVFVVTQPEGATTDELHLLPPLGIL
ncbi:MAG: SDR family NAD(P)-dependent oxidoreductase [Candidatus Poribacteria bacterium]|nr:SDR family NAD(P)-dependent oxidoreductase [Candidatus Poribacteria bacterium]